MTDLSQPLAAPRLSDFEFTALMAMLFATIAFSIDSMLPALPAIAADLTPLAVNRAQLILSSFVLGMGAGTFFVGPLSDAFGRRPVIASGLVLYLVGALAAHFAPSLEWLLVARVVQGLGAAAPRIVGMALTRDLYQGRDMARVMSFVMMVFMVVPALAPMIGQAIIIQAGWRAVFFAFILFGLIALSWVMIRQPETLPVSARRPLSGRLLWSGLREVLADPSVRLYTATMTLGFGQMMSLLSSIQQIFGEVYDRADHFPYWFALIAVFSASASFLNGQLVTRLGMRRMASLAYLGEAVIAAAAFLLIKSGLLGASASFAVFFIWATSVFFIAGLTFGNLNALAMQKMGHLAGMANSVIAAVSTVLAVAIAGPVGLAFNGTALPAILCAVICSVLAYLLMRRSARL